jgi:hypothetical protein
MDNLRTLFEDGEMSGVIKSAIASFTELIKNFVALIKNFVDSMKKQPEIFNQ